MSAAPETPGVPLNLVAELTYRCPLQCPYCSNPVDHRDRYRSAGCCVGIEKQKMLKLFMFMVKKIWFFLYDILIIVLQLKMVHIL